jgi:nitroreductase/YHS domain-containing protein
LQEIDEPRRNESTTPSTQRERGCSVDVLDLIKRRRSVPRFKSDQIPRDVIEKMLEAASWAPNHHLTEPWEFTVLDGAAKAVFADIRRRFRLSLFPDPSRPEAKKAAEKIHQDTIATPTIIAVTVKVADDPEVRDDDFAATFIAIQNMMLTAADLGVGTYMRTGGLVRDPRLREFLQVPSDRRIAAIVYIGYPALVPERRRTPYQEKTRWWTDGAVPQAANPELTAVEASGIAIDPVCKMEVDIATAEYLSEHGGVTYYFCAQECKTAFDADPARYAGLNRNE